MGVSVLRHCPVFASDKPAKPAGPAMTKPTSGVDLDAGVLGQAADLVVVPLVVHAVDR